MPEARQRGTRPGAGSLVVRSLVALGLAVDGAIHLRLASGYQLAAPGGIGEGTLFRLQAVLAIVVALAVLVRGGRLLFVVAFLVAGAALGAVLLYRYVDVPALGPFPSMYEPVWFPEKTLSAVAEALAAIGALGLLAAARRRRSDPTLHAGQRTGGATPTEIR